MLLRLHYTRRYAFFAFFSAFQCLFFCFLENPGASNAIAYTEFLKDGSTVVSADASFELGFFSPGSSTNRFVGIWYKNIPVRTVVWVANREKPINDSSVSLMIDSSGNLVLIGKNNALFWSTNSTKIGQKPVVELLDSGNLVLRDAEDSNVGNYLWQSFDYPTDTLLPGMKIGVSLKTGLERRVIAWKNWDDPSPGSVFWKIQPHKIPESTVWEGNSIIFRTGPWNGISYSGTPQLKPNPIFNFSLVDNDEEVYFIYYQKGGTLTRVVVNQTSSRQERFLWSNESQSWSLLFYWPIDYCDNYTLCGAYGICSIAENPICKCMNRFKPRLQNKWDSGFWSDGCVRNKSLNCQGDSFNKFSGLKLPDTTYTWADKSMDLKQCRAKCLENCSCSAYFILDVNNGGSGCAIWFTDLIDMKQMSSGDVTHTQELYVRVAASESDELNSVKSVPAKKIIGITIAAIAVVIGVLIAGYYFRRNKTRVKEYDKDNEDHEEGDLDLPLFDFNTVSNATSEFSPANKLGEGGFGPVYKGTLSDGQEIAVKRLSRNSGQGLEQLKNEVILIAKLQHRNLVKLLGCCIQGEERLLIYEYMPNKSLDSFIFDQQGAELLDWSKRFNIICGIARGLLYLHQDSRLRIIHRDLKTSNVLLDNEMNPKISDFGVARFIGGDQTEGNTNRVVGTYGYMAPEYAADGFFFCEI